MFSLQVEKYEEWREAARRLALNHVPPEQVRWQQRTLERQLQLSFDREERESTHATLAQWLPLPEGKKKRPLCVPSRFLRLAETVGCHRDDRHWQVLYRVLWRLTHGEACLLEMTTDDDVLTLLKMEREVHRAAHQMKGFLRFHRVAGDHGDEYVAYWKPEHRVLRLTVPFFQQRFACLRWAILTPDESAYWDGVEVRFGPPVPAGANAAKALRGDNLEDLWRIYYGAVFNPTRVNPRALTRCLPSRFWKALPEGEIIEELMKEAPTRVEAMAKQNEGYARSAADFLPAGGALPLLQEAAAMCQGCDLHACGTRTVFGEGPAKARLVLVGEQPGDQEDKVGRPFVGPAGQLLDRALREAGIDREQVYLTNAVKHFKWEPKGQRRLHIKPNAREMAACKPWLEAELEAIEPEVVVCLGATAAQSLLGASFRITRQRGEVMRTDYAPVTLATYHPAALLRMPDENARAQRYAELVADFKLAWAACQLAESSAAKPAQKAKSRKVPETVSNQG